MRKSVLLLAAAMILAASCAPQGRWSVEKANKWYERTGWRTGCNFIPSNAINQIEMWQASSFDPQTIDRELGMAESVGFSTARIFLSSLVWESDPEGFKQRLDQVLDMSDRHGIKPVLVFFDDCWNAESQLGDQPEPRIGTHNSGWVQDPNFRQRSDTAASYPVLKKYVQDIIASHRNDRRILWWDLYNEPSNSGNASLPLLKNVFRWAREARPSQPLSSGVWSFDDCDYRTVQMEESDIISFHNYSRPDEMLDFITKMEACGRPVICTEYLARPYGCTFRDNLPLLKEHNISAINWGLVSGKTNTIYAWEEVIESGDEPEIWFHDIFREDGSAFDDAEIALLRQINGK